MTEISYPVVCEELDKTLLLFIDENTCMRITDNKPLPCFGRVLHDLKSTDYKVLQNHVIEGLYNILQYHYKYPQCNRNAFSKDQREFMKRINDT